MKKKKKKMYTAYKNRERETSSCIGIYRIQYAYTQICHSYPNLGSGNIYRWWWWCIIIYIYIGSTYTVCHCIVTYVSPCRRRQRTQPIQILYFIRTFCVPVCIRKGHVSHLVVYLLQQLP